ncbi:alpha/beta hydrolase [Breoghania sp.]|uniref:alpha/beta hydrolase n=1 Tax=Breoghania sp. TaxID=2065378 RepID=UPI002605B532|nr:alpha/beta hydrolase [Breoghania sp.]MDJ0931342.1 alpha/beta hydrolase [Breoghania sp.]
MAGHTPPGNPATDFTLRTAGYLDGRAAFRRALTSELAKRKPADREAFVFVHGYNTCFPEALHRFTQVVHDAKAPVVPVLFTWASRGSVADYVYDVNSAQIARTMHWNRSCATLLPRERGGSTFSPIPWARTC